MIDALEELMRLQDIQRARVQKSAAGGCAARDHAREQTLLNKIERDVQKLTRLANTRRT